MRSRRSTPSPGVHWTLFVSAVFAALLALTGGSSRGDVPFIVVPRLAAVILVAMLLIGLPAPRLRPVSRVLAATGCAALIMLIQLVPLPPAWWAALPGHHGYAALAENAIGARWRPISLTPDLTVESLVALLPPLALAMAAAATLAPQRRWWIFGILGVAGVSALLGLIQLADGPASSFRWYPITNDFAAVGIFANRNHNAVFLAAVIPLIAALARARCRRLRRDETPEPIIFGAGAAALGLATMAVATGSRFGSIAALVALVISPMLFLAHPRPVIAWRASVRLRISLALGAVLAFTAAGVLVTLSGSGIERAISQGVADDVRTSILPMLFHMIGDFMPFGSGYGSFASVFRNYEPFDQMRLTYLNAAHDDLLQLAIEGGLAGLALLAAYVVAVVRGTILAWRHGGDDLARAASIGIWLLLFASLFDYPLRTPFLASLLAVFSVWLLTDPPVDDTLPQGAHNLGTRSRGA